MNQKQVCIKENIQKVATFLKNSIEWLTQSDSGCCAFDLDENFSIYCGWSDGFDMADTDIIKSPSDISRMGGRDIGWAVCAAVKCRNDADRAEFDFLNAPIMVGENGEVWDTSISMRPNMTEADYKGDARWFLKNYVAMANSLAKNKIELC